MPTSLRDLYIEELQDLYSAEGQIIDALPQMSAAATSPNLKRALEEHLEQTSVQRERLELVFKALGVQPGGRRCAGMEGLITEGRERLRQDGPGDVKDAALIAAAQRVEHYEMAGYGTARTYARLLGDSDSERLLQQTLDEEGAADHRLTDVAMSGINQAAESREDAEDVCSRGPACDTSTWTTSTTVRSTTATCRSATAATRTSARSTASSSRTRRADLFITSWTRAAGS